MANRIYLDMDGTIADLYGVDNWLENLVNGSDRPYRVAKRMVEEKVLENLVNLGYELSAAISQREALLEENRKLRIELRVLSRRDNLEAVAGKQLGMVTIRPEQVLIYDLKKASPSDPSSTKKRIDGLDNVRRIGEE